MRHNPQFDVTELDEVERLIDAHPWATLVSATDQGPVASHYPVLRERDADGLVLLTHLGRPDERIHQLGAGRELLVIFQGPHGYISPTWYADADAPVPTWNFSVVHCHGVPEVLSDEENLAVLDHLQRHFEAPIDAPRELDPDAAAQIARGTVGLRIPVRRWTCKAKASQNKSPETQARVLAALEQVGGPYADPALAAEMRRTLKR